MSRSFDDDDYFDDRNIYLDPLAISGTLYNLVIKKLINLMITTNATILPKTIINTLTTISMKVKCGRLSCGLVREERQILSSTTNAVLSSSYRWGGG